jgi:hypothetical protein
MGRKGVSKRKPSQSTKSKPLTGGAASGSVASAMQSAENQPGRSADKNKAAPASDRKPSTKKG